MKKCSNCGAENLDQSAVCESCGAQLPVQEVQQPAANPYAQQQPNPYAQQQPNPYAQQNAYSQQNSYNPNYNAQAPYTQGAYQQAPGATPYYQNFQQAQKPADVPNGGLIAWSVITLLLCQILGIFALITYSFNYHF